MRSWVRGMQALLFIGVTLAIGGIAGTAVALPVIIALEILGVGINEGLAIALGIAVALPFVLGHLTKHLAATLGRL